MAREYWCRKIFFIHLLNLETNIILKFIVNVLKNCSDAW